MLNLSFRLYEIYDNITNPNLTVSAPRSDVAASVLLVSHVDLCSFGPDATELRGFVVSHVSDRGPSVVHPTYATFLVHSHTGGSWLNTLINGFPHVLGLYNCLKWTCNHLSRSSNGLIILSRRSSRCIGICSGYHIWSPQNK
jgi:hypothetical protein